MCLEKSRASSVHLSSWLPYHRRVSGPGRVRSPSKCRSASGNPSSCRGGWGPEEKSGVERGWSHKQTHSGHASTGRCLQLATGLSLPEWHQAGGGGQTGSQSGAQGAGTRGRHKGYQVCELFWKGAWHGGDREVGRPKVKGSSRNGGACRGRAGLSSAGTSEERQVGGTGRNGSWQPLR